MLKNCALEITAAILWSIGMITLGCVLGMRL